MNLYCYFGGTDELSCRCGECGLTEHDMNPRFMRRIVDMRRLLGIPFVVTSAIRCSEFNSKVSARTGLHGPHTTGHAIDVQVSGSDAMKIVGAARQHGMTGIGVKQHGPHKDRFIHLDDLALDMGRPRPWVWSYR